MADAALTARWEACAGCDDLPGPFGDGPSSTAAADLAQFAGRRRLGRLDIENFIDGPDVGESGVSRKGAGGVGALVSSAHSSLLDVLFDDEPMLLQRNKVHRNEIDQQRAAMSNEQ